jgi:two-component system nitrogen regulation response regulator NtrX
MSLANLSAKPRILIVDDERDIRLSLSGLLEDEGYEVFEAGSDEEAISKVEQNQPDIVLQDIWLEGSKRDGIGVLEATLAAKPDTTVIMMSGHGTIETAVKAIQTGAYDFIEKPFNIDRIYHLLDRAQENLKLKRENAALKARLQAADVTELQGNSPIIQALRNTISKVGPSASRVLITGPAGSGKEVVARAIHAKSNRANGPFVVVNCATLHPERIEQELFGEDFADGRSKPGIFETANSGTLLLDEVADMPINTQGKIVRMLQDLSFTRVGGTQRIEVDVRVLATTQNDLESLVRDGEFREDLYYRLRVFPVVVPGLAERSDDIEVLAEHFLAYFAQSNGQPKRSLDAPTLAALATYAWPGNVRQLRNAIEWMLIMDTGEADEPVGLDSLPPEVSGEGPSAGGGGAVGVSSLISLPLREAREAFERAYLEAQVKRFNGNITKTAQFVGMERSALHRKLKSLNIV